MSLESKRKITKRTKLPRDFKYLMWSYRFSKVDAKKDKERIIINTLNYGQWRHWRWIANYYGRRNLKRIISNIPASEFKKEALQLISLLLGIKQIKYATRGDKLKT